MMSFIAAMLVSGAFGAIVGSLAMFWMTRTSELPKPVKITVELQEYQDTTVPWIVESIERGLAR